jgi:tripartite-type tricarboxylate transporter receptor subunit TctC
LFANPPYEALRDFQMVTCVGSAPNMIAVHPAHPAKSVKELIEVVCAQPGKHNYSSPGTGTTPHLSGEMFRLAFNIDLRHIPYAGAGPQIQALLGAQVPIGFASVPSFATQDMRERLTAIAMTPVGNTPAEFTGQVTADIVRRRKVIRESGIKAD